MSDAGMQMPRTSESDSIPPLTLRALAPGALVPENFSARAQLATWLHGIDHVHVRETVKRDDGNRYYVLDVYIRRAQTNIPTALSANVHRDTEGLRQTHAPALTTERRFSEFATLLSDCYNLAEADHGFLPCAFCPPIVDFVFQDKHVPSRVYTWLHSDTSVCELLSQFINNLLELTSHVPSREHPNDCRGKRFVPQLLKRFLSGDDRGGDEIPRTRGTYRPFGFRGASHGSALV